jgi:tetratricopeptide (TPR) repeat protein
MSSISTAGRVVALVAILSATAAGQPAGQADWSMIVVQQKPDFVLWDADRKIEPGSVGLVYKVVQVNRLNVLLTAPGHGVRGWSPLAAVISLKLAEEFFTQGLLIKPDDHFAYMMRGIVRSEKGNANGALADLDEALKRDPKYVPALVRRAAMLRARNLPDRALGDLEKAIAADGREPSAYVERAVLGFTRRDFERVWSDLDRAAELGSHDVIVPILRGQMLLEKQDTKRAHEAFASALKVDPSRHDAYLGLASVYLMRGQARIAESILDGAVQGDPNNPEAYGNRATLHLARGDDEKALFNLDEVIRLSPGSARAYNERAWLLATCRVEKFRDAPRAVESATRACELTGWKNPRYLATLAAAYSETGDFAAAVHNQKRAVELLDDRAPEAAEYHRLLNRYRMKKPHHALSLFQELGILSVPAAARTDE